MVWAGALLIAVAAVDFAYLCLRRPITTPLVIRAGADGLAIGIGIVLAGAHDGLVPLVTGPGFTVIGYYVGQNRPSERLGPKLPSIRRGVITMLVSSRA